MTSIILPDIGNYQLREPKDFTRPTAPLQSRVLYAAAHVVTDEKDHGAPVINWDATIAFREHLWSWGLGVAEAMDTAQRGMGLDWENTKELITRSLKAAKSSGGAIACGAGTDQLAEPYQQYQLDDVIRAYEEQVEFIESRGGKVILMASRALAAIAKDADDYARVYDRILSGTTRPVIIHWLGEMFDPALAGYWGADNFPDALATCTAIIKTHATKIDGIKMSLLDDQKEIELRRQLPTTVKVYTGDDFNYPALIEGDEAGFSHALLGIFDAIAPAASAAIQALDEGNIEKYRSILEPTVPLSRHIFEAPTWFYKTGIVFLAWLNGHQKYFYMVGGLETKRSREHLIQLFQLADQAGLLSDPELAVARMQEYLKS